MGDEELGTAENQMQACPFPVSCGCLHATSSNRSNAEQIYYRQTDGSG